jgi:hypothetical protein
MAPRGLTGGPGPRLDGNVSDCCWTFAAACASVLIIDKLWNGVWMASGRSLIRATIALLTQEAAAASAAWRR